MKTVYLERSTGEVRQSDWTESVDLAGVERIVVGIGPGSFAGIRAALAFAQGYVLARRSCEVLGLPSPCAVAAQYAANHPNSALAVVGDARQGKIWIALFDGLVMRGEVFQVSCDDLASAIPDGFAVVTSDPKRLDERLRGLFGDRYEGGVLPTAEGLRAYAEAMPETLKREPLPIYLNPAVRKDV